MAKYLDETGAEQLNQLLAAKFDTKVDKYLATKTYTNILGVADDTTYAENTFYFASIKPITFTDTWAVRYRIYIWCENDNNYRAMSECWFMGVQSGVASYAIFNNIYSTSYRPAYYHTMYRLLQDGFNAGYGHALGFSLKDANAKDTAGKERSVKVDILQQVNCQVTLLNNVVKWGSWEGNNTTNYSGADGSPSTYNFSANGLQETGDANDNTIAYIIKSYYEKAIVGAGNVYKYNLCTYDSDWKIQGFVNSASTGTTKTKNNATFRIGAPIFYLNSSSNATVGSPIGDNLLCLEYNYIDFRYSSNCGSTMVVNKPVFLVGVPAGGSTYTLADTWWTQTLPTTEDGKIYILLGYTYTSSYKYRISFSLEKPIYWYKNGALRLYTDDSNYIKPTGGIPKTDLTSDVQTSLGKADTALQSYTETDPTVPAAVKAITSTDISNWNAKGTYSKPNGGIPKTDLASAVQTSLGLADTALQSYTETDPTVPSHVKNITSTDITNWNNKGSGTITKVQANGTDVASSGTANIPAASTSAYGVTKLSSATDSTSEVLAATPKAVKAAYDLAAGKGTGTITGVSVNGTSVATSGVANITSVPASILSGAIPSAVTATTQSASDNSTKIATTAFVQTAIDNLPEPMVFKGSLGTGGTITALPTNGTANIGDTYKVITAGTYASKAAKVGDTFICLTKTSSANTWELIPSGDEPSGTVTSVTIKATSPIAVSSSSAITTSGERTISHATSGVTAGTYRSVTVNDTGHVTAGTNPITISGYGITDAKIENGTITLGSNTITPLTNNSTLDATKLSGTIPSGCYTDTKNTAGSTNTSGKIYLIGATSQAANPQTYSNSVVYAEDGTLAAHKTEIGVNVQANGNYSAVFGMNTRANGAESFSQGVGSYAQGDYSHAEGYQTISNGNGTHTEGYHTVAIGSGAHAENGSSYTRSIKITGGANATTYTTTNTNGAKIGNYLEYNGTIRKITNLTQNTSVTVEATFSSESLTNQTVFLTSTTASGTGAHAEGGDTLALGNFSHTEGWDTKTTGSASHAEGSGTTASETATHAEGSATIASGASSHAEGINTIAQRKAQHTQGEYNILDSSGTTTTRGTYVHIVGNGTADNARSNAHTLDWSGNAWFAGDVYVGSTSGTNKDAGSKKLITADEISTNINAITPAQIDAIFAI